MEERIKFHVGLDIHKDSIYLGLWDTCPELASKRRSR